MTQENNNYFGYVRTDVLQYVPSSAKSVLSIGCGYGKTEKVLVDRGVHVTGIEPSTEAAPIASSNGLSIIQKGALEGLQELKGKEFDCIILSDVLEHLSDPKAVLKLCSDLISTGATIVISVPNFRHYSVFYHLFIRGSVPNRDAGIFDNTHLQITTMKRMEEWIEFANAQTVHKEYKFSGRLETFLSKVTFGFLNEFLAPQVILSAFKN